MAGEEKEEESKEYQIPKPHFPNPSKSLQKNLPFSDFIKNNNKTDLVFPPIEHEGLPPSPPSETLVPSPPSPEDGGGDVARRWLRAKVVRFVSFWDCFCGFFNEGANGSFCCGAVTVAVLVWWFFRRRRRMRDHMVLVIQEKDEKIKQLLHQIAQMNQLLLSLHKGASSQGGSGNLVN